MLCSKCGSGGPLLCKACMTRLVDSVLETDRRARGELGFKPIVSEDGADLVRFMVEQAGAAVDELHAAAAALSESDPERAKRARKAADELFAARKKAKEMVAHGIDHR